MSKDDDRTLTDSEAQELLARAAELERDSGDLTSMARLREAAVEAGISREAFDTAASELAARRSASAPLAGILGRPLNRTVAGLLIGASSIAITVGLSAAIEAHVDQLAIMSIGLMAGGLLAKRFRARLASIALLGLGLATGLELLSRDVLGHPVRGFDAHWALLIGCWVVAALASIPDFRRGSTPPTSNDTLPDEPSRNRPTPSDGALMQRALATMSVFLLVAGCSGQPQGNNRDTMTQRQKDSVLAQSAIPGAGGVGKALAASDSLKARQAALDSASKP